MGQVSIIQGDDEVVGSGSFIVTRQSPPVLMDAGENGTLAIAFDLDEPFTRPNGEKVKPAFDDAAVSPRDTAANPKVRAIGTAGMRVECFLTPTGLPEPLPDGTGRNGHLNFLFNFRVLVPSRGRRTAPPKPFEWFGPPRPIVPNMGVPYVNLDLMSWEEREAHHYKTNPWFTPPKEAGALEILGQPPTGTVGKPYFFKPQVMNGRAPFTFKHSGELLAGFDLTFDAAEGAIVGTPKICGSASGNAITVKDALGRTATLGPFYIGVSPAIEDAA